jgi:hypothetical protein
MKRFLILLTLALCFSSSFALAANAPAILPGAFAGWEKSESKGSTDAAIADPANAAILKEYGFSDVESAQYTKAGRKMEVKAARFTDASGAYGAFTFYKLPQMLTEQFGDQGASLNERVLFYRGSVLVQATLDRVTAMSAAELRELSDAIPLPPGPSRNLPTLPQYLPRQAYVKNSAKYVVGPLALNSVGAPLTAGDVDFGRSAEVTVAHYSTSNGTATLMLIAYPTPQIAGERQRAFEALNQNPPAQQDASMAAPFTLKRSGPIVALVAGQISASEAKSLLASIHYDADVTWSQDTGFNNRLGSLLVNIITLAAILIGLALVAGLAFGGIRILSRRLFNRTDDMEFLELKLRK